MSLLIKIIARLLPAKDANILELRRKIKNITEERNN
jgi:hypothetical protein